MNKLAPSIPNKIKQPAQCCVYCGKSYKKITNLNKHVVVCDLIQKSKRRALTGSGLRIEEDEEEPLPSQRKMFEMLMELGQKYSRLEEKVDEINKWVVKKKKKINVLEWLNANITPTITFENIIDKITVNEKDIEMLINNTFYDVLNEIFGRTIYNFNEHDNPIFAFINKSNMFYIYNANKVWDKMSTEIFIKFLNRVHMKIFKAFNEWKSIKLNDTKNNSSDAFAISCNKTMVKIVSVECNNESVVSKVQSSMFSRMKTDMKALVEYEFEF